MKLTLNLASRSYLNRRALYFGYAIVIAALTCLLMINVFSSLQTLRHEGQVRQHLAGLESEQAQQAATTRKELDARQQNRLLADVAFANDILSSDSFRWTELLDRLEKVVPDRVRLRQLKPDYKEGSLRIEGDAKTVTDLRVLLDQLILSPDFTDVYLLSQSRQDGAAGQQVIKYSILIRGALSYE